MPEKVAGNLDITEEAGEDDEEFQSIFSGVIMASPRFFSFTFYRKSKRTKKWKYYRQEVNFEILQGLTDGN